MKSTSEKKETPAELGFIMPAEWESHIGTWLTWPRSSGISFPDRYSTIPPVYAAFIRELLQGERVFINAWDRETEASIREVLIRSNVSLEGVSFYPFQSYEPWCRDHGPIFLVRHHEGRRERAIVDWGYNAWGNKYPPYDLDDAVPQHIARLRGLPLYSPGIVLEGGSIEVNGQGTLLTTEACLLNPNRNPHLSKSAIETYLRDYLGVKQIIWLGDGIVGDDTDGHIDDLARFVSPETIVTVVEEDPQDENYDLLKENHRRLLKVKTTQGGLFRIITLPMPSRIEMNGQRLPASYANFYIANSAVIMPTFGCPNDRRAIDILQKEFPTRRVVGLDSRDLIWGLGSFHCISQQEPA